jgi:hypothetical protein
MQRNDSRRSNSISPLGWGVVWLGLGLLLAAWPAAVLGDEPVPPPESDASNAQPENFWFSDRFTGRSQQSIGGLIRGGVVTGPGIGRENSLVPLEFMPYSMWGNGMLLGDLRGFRGTDDHWGANVGLGYRHYVPTLDRIFGFNAFYDYDNTSTKLFRQLGFGMETYGAGWDMRLNTYFPIQTEAKLLRTDFVPDSVEFSGNLILFDQIRTLGTPMRGLDHELGVPLPGRFAEQTDARAYVGWYHFQADGVPNAWGWKGRLQADVLPNLSLGLEVTNDQVFDTNVIFSAAISYGGYRQPDDQPATQFGRMTTPINRQYNVVVGLTHVLDEDLVALKPDGTPYFVEHVASSDPYDRNDLALMLSLAPQYDPLAAPGTYENPFEFIADAQGNGVGDIIYTWTNSVYDGVTLGLEPDVRVLGEADGVVHRIELQPFGFVDMPRAVNNPNPAVTEVRPQFLNMVGNGVTFADPNTAEPANNSEFSGFVLGDPTDDTAGPTGNGLIAADVTNVDVRFVDINFAQADGVQLNAVNEMRFFQTLIFNAAETGLHIVGGRPTITFEGDGDPATPDIVYNSAVQGGHAVLIEGTAAGSFVDLFSANPSAIDYTGAGGILITGAAGSARFGDIEINNNIATLPEAINLINDSGAYTFSAPVNISDSFEDSINIENLGSTGVVSFLLPVNIVDRGGHGVDIRNVAGNGNPTRFSVSFRDDLSITTTAGSPTSALPAIEYQLASNFGSVSFDDIVIDGGAGEGILIGDPDPLINNDGIFIVRGLTDIDGIDGINIDIIDDDATVTFSGVDIDDRGDTGIRIRGNREAISFDGRTVVSNSRVSTGTQVFDSTAIIIDGNTNFVQFENVTVNAAYNSVPGVVAGFAGDPAGSVAGVAVGGANDVFDPGNRTNPGRVEFDVLSITTLAAAGGADNAGVALGARFVGDYVNLPISGGLFIDSGIIDSINATAVDVQASVIGIAFDAVSALDSIGPGILMANNVGGGTTNDFFVIGDGPDPLFPGGTIENAQQLPNGSPLLLFDQDTNPTSAPLLPAPPLSAPSGAGVLLRDTGVVVLNNMLIQTSEVGIDVQTDALFLDSSSVQNNLTFGLDALDTLRLEVTNSTFTGNGPGLLTFVDNNEIRATVSTVEDYFWRFDNNDIVDSQNSAVLIQTTGSGAGASLTLNFTNNPNVVNLATVGVVANPACLEINWDGPLSAFIDNNFFQFLAVADAGIAINTLSSTDLAAVTITNNNFQGTASGNVGIDVSALGPSSYLIENNILQHTDPTASMRFFLADNSVTTIRNNTINIPIGETREGIVFTSVNEPAIVRMEGNVITINGTDFFFDEIGIDFQATSGVINLFSDFDNVVTLNGVQGNGFPWFNFPVNGLFTGSILINGVPEP